GVDCDSEDFWLVGGPEDGALAGGGDFVDASAVSGSCVEGAVRGLGDAPDNGLAGGEDGVELGSESHAAVAGERQAVEASFDEVLVGGHFPEGWGGGSQREGEKQGENGSHSFTSTWTVLDPETAMPEPSSSNSASLELRLAV